ncbi:MAG: RNA polymerase sigma factor [Myxococcales bacterium]|nr:RNA polymerase sigma factor [Myxococcales bacterium]
MDPDGIHRRDHELTSRCISGDPTAQRALFDGQRARVQSRFSRILGRSDEVEDLVQECFFLVFRSLPTFRSEALLATWIDRIAVRVAFAHLRKRKRRVRIDLVGDFLAETAAEPRWSAERVPLEREALRRVLTVFESLEPKQRQALMLHAIEGKSEVQIATHMGCSVRAAKARIFRARRTLVQRAGCDPVLSEYVTGRSQERGLT